MSGIIGIASRHNAVPGLLQGLRQMGHTMHNNCGLVVYGRQGQTASAPRLHRHRRAQPIAGWMDPLDMLDGRVGMGHIGQNRTQGPQGLQAVLPHFSHGPNDDLNSPARVAVVAQGQLQDTRGLRNLLQERGYRFKSDSDSELLAHLIDATHPGNALQALHRTLGLVVGNLAMGVMFHDQPGQLFAVQRGVGLYWHFDGESIIWTSASVALSCSAEELKLLPDGLMLEIQSEHDRIRYCLHE